jgi:hypothetical protein
MTLNEIRIGNLFIGYNDEVFEWDLERFEYLVDSIDIDEIIKNEIPITEEICIKFGYECLQELISDMVHNAKHPISNNIGLWVVTASGLKVHELQNLYFTLTSQELTFKK